MAAASGDLEGRLMSAVKASAARGEPPLLQAAEASATCGGARGSLAAALVSNLCFAHNTGAMWKLLDQAMASRLVSPLHTLALLTSRSLPPTDSHFSLVSVKSIRPAGGLGVRDFDSRVISRGQLLCRVVPNRRAQPEAYRLYLELLGRYALVPEYSESAETKAM
jgi:hypothetical protein